jgi:hypothetical protein
MDDQDSGRPSRRKQFRELLFRRRGSSARGNQGSSPATPPTQLEEIERKPIQTDLWGAAYEKIQKEDPKLLVAYKKYLLAPDQGMSSSDSTFYPADIAIMALGCYKPEERLPLSRK